MKYFVLAFIHLAFAIVLITAACNGNANSKLAGSWRSADGSVRLKISGNKFTTESESPVAEDYVLKGDTIFTSFEGNPPSKFVIQKLNDHTLTLLYPDSVSIEFAR